MQFLYRSSEPAVRNVIGKSKSRNRGELYRVSSYRMTTRSRMELFGLRARKNGGLCIAKRYATAPMPYRPGYGLGSIIEPTVIEGMETEAKVRSEIVILEQLERDFESTAKSLKNERDRLALEAELDNASFDAAPYDAQIQEMMDQRKPIKEKRLAAYKELFKTMSGLIESGGAATTFNSGAASPIKWPECDVTYLDRAYDYITIN